MYCVYVVTQLRNPVDITKGATKAIVQHETEMWLVSSFCL